MATIGERLAKVEQRLADQAEILGRVETYITTDRVALENRITSVEHKVTVRTWAGGALAVLPQLLHYLIPGASALPPGHSA